MKLNQREQNLLKKMDEIFQFGDGKDTRYIRGGTLLHLLDIQKFLLGNAIRTNSELKSFLFSNDQKRNRGARKMNLFTILVEL